MSRLTPSLTVLALCLTFAGLSLPGSVTNCTQLMRQERSVLPSAGPLPFDIIATVTAVDVDGLDAFAIQDDTGAVYLKPKRKIDIPARPGDRAIVHGGMLRNEFNETVVHPTNITVLSRGTPPPPVQITLAEVKSGRFDHRLVRLTGVVRNIFDDDVDPNYRFLVLTDNREIAYVVLGQTPVARQASNDLLGSRVSVAGIVSTDDLSLTRQTYRRIPRLIVPVSDGIVVHAPAAERLPTPDLQSLAAVAPEDFPLAVRHRTCGRVLAVWRCDTLLLHAQFGQIVRVRLAQPTPPAVDDIVDVIGFPEHNLFTLGLDAATWRPSSARMPPEPAPVAISVRAAMEDRHHRIKVDVGLHGRIVCLSGQFRGKEGPSDGSRYLLDCDGYLIPVDVGGAADAFHEIPVGSTVAATGVCAMDIDDWRPSAAFPRVRGFSIVLRAPADVRLVVAPGWWTPGRLTALLCALFAVLLGSALLNVVLKKLVARRERELAAEIGTRVASECKVRERTRLAVELHDAISQNLTGVALQLRTVGTFAAALPSLARQHLAVAARTLDSCRDELRYCLWDLRSNTLEQKDMNDAIRKTIAPHVGDAELVVRFNVPRAKLTDNTAHALLHVIRELASNAVRHGRATGLRIAGCLDNGRLLFSVSDNGCGFDPDRCPGMESGHFGLLGVRERIEGLDGDLTISSDSRGTRVSASLPAPDTASNKI